MKDFKIFAEEVRERVQEQFKDEVILHEVSKVNELTLQLTLRKKNEGGVFPSINLKDYYMQYLSGWSISQCASKLIDVIHTSMESCSFDEKDIKLLIQDFNNVKEKIIFELINSNRNKELMEQIPHVLVLEDLALVFRVLVNGRNGADGSILITNELCYQNWNIELDILENIARKNTPNILRHELIPMRELISFLEFENHMYILTNQEHIWGASVMCYDGVLEKIADEFESDLYILPSSLHEVLVLPALKTFMPEREINKMIRDVNETSVDESEILSNHFYYYERDGKKLR